MRRLAIIVAGTIPVFGGLIVAAMIGGGRLHPDWTPYFDHVQLCDKRFCAFGIVPGVTTWSQAETILNIQLSDIVNSNLIYTGLSDRVDRTIFQARGYKNNPETPVVEMLFWMPPSTSSKSLTVGAFIARFGPPCFVYYTDFGWPLFTLYYPFGVVSTQSPADYPVLTGPPNRLDPNLPIIIESGTYNATEPDAGALTIQCRDFRNGQLPNALPWRGFRAGGLFVSSR